MGFWTKVFGNVQLIALGVKWLTISLVGGSRNLMVVEGVVEPRLPGGRRRVAGRMMIIIDASRSTVQTILVWC
jgi:hypothetical protein